MAGVDDPSDPSPVPGWFSGLSALDMVVDHAWFHQDTIPQLVLGGVVYVIAQVMEVGRQIEERESLTGRHAQ